MATTQVVPEGALLPWPPAAELGTDWLFRNAARTGEAGQLFQAEVVPIRGLEPVNEGCPKGREERRKEIWLKLQGRLIFFRRGVRHQESAFITKVSLAVKTRSLEAAALAGPRAPRPRAGAWSAWTPGRRLGWARGPHPDPPRRVDAAELGSWSPRYPRGARALAPASPWGRAPGRPPPVSRSASGPGQTPGGGPPAARPPLRSRRVNLKEMDDRGGTGTKGPLLGPAISCARDPPRVQAGA